MVAPFIRIKYWKQCRRPQWGLTEDSEYLTEFWAGTQHHDEHPQTPIGDLSLEYSVKWEKKGKDQCVGMLPFIKEGEATQIHTQCLC